MGPAGTTSKENHHDDHQHSIDQRQTPSHVAYQIRDREGLVACFRRRRKHVVRATA